MAATPTERLQQLGQSLWLDNITRAMLDDGTLQRYVETLSVTGLTSNPSIFQKAIQGSSAYDAAIAAAAPEQSTEALFFQLALGDLQRAAALFAPVHAASQGLDGWVSLEVSPLLADDAQATTAAAVRLHREADCSNLFIKIPGTRAGVQAVEDATFAGVPVNVTLLFSRGQYVAASEAWMRGIERRLEAGLDARVHSVASLFVSRWDVAVAGQVSPEVHNRVGVAVAAQAWCAYRELLRSTRWQRLAAAGTPVQRLLWASTGTKDPAASDVLYVDALAAPDTINTIPDKTLLAYADHGSGARGLPEDGGDWRAVLAEAARARVAVDVLANRLQREGTEAFVASWHALLQELDRKRARAPAD